MAFIVGVLASGGEAAEAAPSNPVIPDVAELLYGAIFFLTLLALMRYVLLPPLQKVMRAREDAERQNLEAAEKALSEAEKVRRDYDHTLHEAKTAAASAVDQARAEADAIRAKLIADAEATVAQARADAMADIAGSRRSALDGARGDVADLAALAASKVLGRSVGSADAAPVVDALMAEVK